MNARNSQDPGAVGSHLNASTTTPHGINAPCSAPRQRRHLDRANGLSSTMRSGAPRLNIFMGSCQTTSPSQCHSSLPSRRACPTSRCRGVTCVFCNSPLDRPPKSSSGSCPPSRPRGMRIVLDPPVTTPAGTFTTPARWQSAFSGNGPSWQIPSSRWRDSSDATRMRCPTIATLLQSINRPIVSRSSPRPLSVRGASGLV